MKDNFKNTLKAGLLFGILMGIFFGVINSITEGILFGFIWVLISGSIAGTIFGLLMFAFANFQAKRFKDLKEEMSKTEKIVYDGGANHFIGKEAVGGWLFLTEDALKFKSHKYNLQNHTLEISISNIKTAVVTKTLKLILNGLVIETVNDKRERFVVNSPDVWIKYINSYREANI